MRLIILRHATAGHKRDWTGPDAQRPLDIEGERTAELLAKVLADDGVRRLVSSPTTRCIQTLGPLAELCDIPIELWDGLGPDADAANIVACFTNPAFADAVLCTHGEVISPLLTKPAFRTLMRDCGLSQAKLLTKGTAWRLRLTPKGKEVGFKHRRGNESTAGATTSNRKTEQRRRPRVGHAADLRQLRPRRGVMPQACFGLPRSAQ
jgi:phosphohistidine phosphatase SixA